MSPSVSFPAGALRPRSSFRVFARRAVALSALGVALLAAGGARADATVSVGSGFSAPPPSERPPIIVVSPDDRPPEDLPGPPPREVYRSPVRLLLGPAFVTTGQGMGPGLALAAEFGRGTVGLRLSASWLRGENPDDPSARLGSAVGQYAGELTLDLYKRGPLHPVIGVGLGVTHIDNARGGGFAAVGIARAALEYSLGLDDADVRLGAGVTGALTGPEDREMQDVRGYAIVGGTLTIGF